MIKVGIEAVAFLGGGVDKEEGFKRAKEIGYDCFDYNLAPRNSYLYKLTDEEFKKELISIKETGLKHGIEISQVHSVWPHDTKNDLFANLKERKADMPHYIKTIKGANYLGAKHVVLHTAMPYGWTADIDEDYAHEVNYLFFKELIKYAEDEDVILCLENLPFHTHLANVPSLVKFVREFNNPRVKICFDTGHANVLKENVADDIRLIGKDLACMHVHDNKRADDHMMPYTGVIDWQGFVTALNEIGYKGVLSLETYFGDNVIEPYRTDLNKMLYRIARDMANKIG